MVAVSNWWESPFGRESAMILDVVREDVVIPILPAALHPGLRMGAPGSTGSAHLNVANHFVSRSAARMVMFVKIAWPLASRSSARMPSDSPLNGPGAASMRQMVNQSSEWGGAD